MCVRREGIELRWSGEKLMLSAGTSAAAVDGDRDGGDQVRFSDGPGRLVARVAAV